MARWPKGQLLGMLAMWPALRLALSSLSSTSISACTVRYCKRASTRLLALKPARSFASRMAPATAMP